MKVEIINNGKTEYVIRNQAGDEVIQANQYLLFLLATGKSINTVRSYAYHICIWLRYCEVFAVDWLNIYGKSNNRPIDIFVGFLQWLQYPDLSKGIYHLAKEEPARTNRTINLIMGAVLSFYQYLSSNNVIPELPVYRSQRINASYKSFLSELYHHSIIHKSSVLKKPEVSKPVDYITRAQYREMIEHCYLLRDRIILSLMFEGGLRLGETLGIHLQDLAQLEEGIIHITPRENNENGARVKRYARGVIKVPDYIVNAILNYLENEHDEYETDYLFVAFSGPRRGKALMPDSVEKLFNRISTEMGMPLHPHMLRHGFATEKLNEGWELMDIQAYLRHKSIRTTEIYAFYSDELKIRKMQGFLSNYSDMIMETYDGIKQFKGNAD